MDKDKLIYELVDKEIISIDTNLLSNNTNTNIDKEFSKLTPQ